MISASFSLPAPVGPEMSTAASEGATCTASETMSCICALR
jgi:hypothetical protein